MSDALIESILGRLRDQVEPLRLVAGAAGFSAASESNPPAVPAAYVFRTGEAASDEASIDAPFLQRIELTIAVVLVVRHVGGTPGDGAAGDLEALAQAVKAALRGFAPSTEHDPLVLQQSALVTFRDRHEWWQQTWQSATYEGV